MIKPQADALNPDFETPDLTLGRLEVSLEQVNPYRELLEEGRNTRAIYRSIRELPTSVKNALPVEAQRVFMSVINRALDEGDAEADAFRLAWGVIKKTWHKDDAGTWRRRESRADTTLHRLTLLN